MLGVWTLTLLFRLGFLLRLFRADADALDLYPRQLTAMPDRAVITFAPFKLEGDHFFIFALLDHFSRHFCSGNERIAMRELIAVSIHQYVTEGGLLSSIDIEQIDIDRVALCHTILPATGLNNCVSHKRFGEKKPRKIPQVDGLRKPKGGSRSPRAMLRLGGEAAIIWHRPRSGRSTFDQEHNFAFWRMGFIVREKFARCTAAEFFEFLGELARDAELPTRQDVDTGSERFR